MSIHAEPAQKKPRHRWRRLAWAAAVLAVCITTTVVAFMVSPRPGSLVIRWAFDKGGKSANEALAKHVPAGVAGVTDIAYADNGSDATLDVWYPQDTSGPLPTVVWVHGGGWVSGDKSQIANYLKIIAARGYTVVGVNYSLAPGTKYPTPVRQVNNALAFIRSDAARFNVDADKIVLAGDSAGAQIAAQLAAITTSQTYAAEVGISPSLPPASLVGTVLNCGPYVPSMVRGKDGLGGWFVKTVAWAYMGTKDFDAPIMAQADLVANSTASFPPTWISGGNDDPLTEQGEAFASHLNQLGVDVTPLFFPADHEPALGHEYQFDLSLEASRHALEGTVSFLERVTRESPA